MNDLRNKPAFPPSGAIGKSTLFANTLNIPMPPGAAVPGQPMGSPNHPSGALHSEANPPAQPAKSKNS